MEIWIILICFLILFANGFADRNLTRGWCLISTATLHRFFWKEYDLFKCPCPYDEENDFHWWLQNASGDVIDLAEEQYRISKIYENLRQNGKKVSSFPGASYPARGRNLAWKLAEYVSSSEINYDLIGKYPSEYKSMKIDRYHRPPEATKIDLSIPRL